MKVEPRPSPGLVAAYVTLAVIVLTAVGLGLPVLATAALWAHVIIVGGSGVFLFADSLRRLHHADRPAPTAGS